MSFRALMVHVGGEIQEIHRLVGTVLRERTELYGCGFLRAGQRKRT